jgi:hypothetical protein
MSMSQSDIVVNISRVHGFDYPSLEWENRIIKNYFNSNQLVELHNGILLTDDLVDYNLTLMHHHVQNQCIFPYIIVSIRTDGIEKSCIKANTNNMTVTLVSTELRHGKCSNMVYYSFHRHHSPLPIHILPTSSPFATVGHRHRLLSELQHDECRMQLLRLDYHQPVITRMIHLLAPNFVLPQKLRDLRQPSVMLVDFQHDMQIKGIS